MYNEYFLNGNIKKRVSKKEFYEYMRKYKAGDKEAFDEIIKCNLLLIIDRINKRFCFTPYDKTELISVGVIGLIKSVITFDISKDYEFATYASKCIDNEILKYMKKEKKYVEMDRLEKSIGLSKDGTDLRLIDILKDESINITSNYEDKELYSKLREIINELPDDERKIIMLRFGFINDRIYNQTEIAKIYNVSQSYMSRTILRILKKIGNELVKKDLVNKRMIEIKMRKIREK